MSKPPVLAKRKFRQFDVCAGNKGISTLVIVIKYDKYDTKPEIQQINIFYSFLLLTANIEWTFN